jgi:hypothetical protein
LAIRQDRRYKGRLSGSLLMSAITEPFQHAAPDDNLAKEK